MVRPWHMLVIFGLSFTLVLIAMSEITFTVLKLDQAEAKSHQQTIVEENVRLALWRMDSALAQIIAQESIIPYFFYNSFYPTERAYTRMFATIKSGEILVPSPLLKANSPYAYLHFQCSPENYLSSPEVPRGNMRDLAETEPVYLKSETIQQNEELLKEIQKRVQFPEILNLIPAIKSSTETPISMGQLTQRFQQKLQKASIRSQKVLNDQEWQSRSKTTYNYQNPGSIQLDNGLNFGALSNNVEQGTLKPIWNDGMLLLARRVLVNGENYIQGCWLNWEKIERGLLQDVQDLLPQARLLPIKSGMKFKDSSRVLATLPVRLIPGNIMTERPPSHSSVRISIAIAWCCVLLSIIAVSFLLAGAVALSERRGAFVSSVTHELRTPLTTFKMYTEMLVEGMVTSQKQQNTYLKTLQTEANRLSHLVENVLSYSRIERGNTQTRATAFSLYDFFQQIQNRLAERSGQVQMKLKLESSSENVAEIIAFADQSAVEQILFNLVDNASKYASSGEKKEISVEFGKNRSHGMIKIRDYGPGISRKERKKLFRPFSKSAHEAAHSAPGVGLGLALSRRLAKSMKGDLKLDKNIQDGACFILTLPLAH